MVQEAWGLLLGAISFRIKVRLQKNIYNCKGVSKNRNVLHFEHHKDVLNVFHKTAIVSELDGGNIDKTTNVCLMSS